MWPGYVLVHCPCIRLSTANAIWTKCVLRSRLLGETYVLASYSECTTKRSKRLELQSFPGRSLNPPYAHCSYSAITRARLLTIPAPKSDWTKMSRRKFVPDHFLQTNTIFSSKLSHKAELVMPTQELSYVYTR